VICQTFLLPKFFTVRYTDFVYCSLAMIDIKLTLNSLGWEVALQDKWHKSEFKHLPKNIGTWQMSFQDRHCFNTWKQSLLYMNRPNTYALFHATFTFSSYVGHSFNKVTSHSAWHQSLPINNRQKLYSFLCRYLYCKPLTFLPFYCSFPSFRVSFWKCTWCFIGSVKKNTEPVLAL